MELGDVCQRVTDQKRYQVVVEGEGCPQMRLEVVVEVEVECHQACQVEEEEELEYTQVFLEEVEEVVVVEVLHLMSWKTVVWSLSQN